MSICLAMALLAGLLYPAIYMGYRQVLAQKRLEISNVVTDDLARFYRRVFGISTEALFKKSYSLYSYSLAVVLNAVFAFGLVLLALERAGLTCVGSVELQTAVSTIPPAVVAALAGAYLWGLYDALRRYRSVSLTPESLHFMWLRVAIAGAISPFVALTFQGGLATLIGFGLGAFPLGALLNFVQAQAAEKLKIKGQLYPSEEPTLQNIQGLTSSALDSLAEIGIESTEHLAYADPLKLFLRTNLPWKVILDMIDGALLFNYVGPRMEGLRPLGIRGAIELSAINDLFTESNAQDRGQELVKLIARTISQAEESVRNLIQTVEDDYQVRFVAELWGSAYSQEQVTTTQALQTLEASTP
jgi:hypothetical protein